MAFVCALLIIAVTVCVSIRFLHPRQKPYLTVEREVSTNVALSGVVEVDAGGATAASVMSSGSETWVIDVVTNSTQERAGSLLHLKYDFMKDGDEPLHMFATQLEPGFVVAVYKEHGATRVLVIKKDDPPPKGTGMWQEAGTQTVIEDDDLDGAKVYKATITGHVSDRTLRIAFSRAKPGSPPATTTFKLQWLGGKPRRAAEQ